MTTNPDPLTPADCDLRPFRDMPLDIGRFRRSDLVTHEDPDAVLAALLLWGAAWHEVPAASVPNNDKWLANAAGYGRAVDAWLAVKQGALRGFVLCSDGRLYNRTLAEKANAAWEARQQHDWRRAVDRHRKAQRSLPEDQRTQFPDFEDWKAGKQPEYSAGSDDLFQRTDPEIPTENALKGREGNGREGNGVLDADANASAARAFAIAPDDLKAFRAHRVRIKKPMTDRAEQLLVGKLEHIWNDHGHEPADVINQSILNGWVGVFPLKQEEDSSGRANRNGDRDDRTSLGRAIDRRMGRG